MKKLKNIICCALCLAMAAALCACSAQDNKSTDNNNQIANPVHESSAEEFKAAGIVMPEIEGKTPVYTTIERRYDAVSGRLRHIYHPRAENE